MKALVQNKVGFSRLKQNKGFSLVELMVVVAIIGILSAVAVPSVNKYMAKARQTEAKANLSMYYGANKVFFTEYGIFDTNFATIGFKPEGRMRYNVGHTVNGADGATLTSFGYTAGIGPGIDNINTRTHCKNNLGVGGKANNACRSTPEAAASPAVAGGCAPAINRTASFTACAAGRITNRAGLFDSWEINQEKTLRNRIDGTE